MAAERETIDRLIAHLPRPTGSARSSTAASPASPAPACSCGWPTPARTASSRRHARGGLLPLRRGACMPSWATAPARRYRLGDAVRVKLVEAAPLAGALRFEMLSEGRRRRITAAAAAPPRARPSASPNEPKAPRAARPGEGAAMKAPLNAPPRRHPRRSATQTVKGIQAGSDLLDPLPLAVRGSGGRTAGPFAPSRASEGKKAPCRTPTTTAATPTIRPRAPPARISGRPCAAALSGAALIAARAGCFSASSRSRTIARLAARSSPSPRGRPPGLHHHQSSSGTCRGGRLLSAETLLRLADPGSMRSSGRCSRSRCPSLIIQPR